MSDVIHFTVEDVIHLDNAINHLFSVVRLRDVRLTTEEVKALHTLEDKASRYRQKVVLFDLLNECSKTKNKEDNDNAS